MFVLASKSFFIHMGLHNHPLEISKLDQCNCGQITSSQDNKLFLDHLI